MSSKILKLPIKLIGRSASVALDPLLTAPLLWALTKGPQSLREALLKPFGALGYNVDISTLVKALKWLLALGIVGKINKALNAAALNAWRWKDEKKRWQWNKEVAVVTGGCSGIGLLVVRGLMKKGVKVAVLDVQPLPEKMQGYANLKYYQCDITSPKAVQETASAIQTSLGDPSILVNNAGIGSAHTILDTTPEQLQKIFNVNLLSHWTTVQAFLPAMIAANKGHIVTIASMASYVTVASIVDYGATKAGALAFHEGLSLELKHRYNAPNVLTTSVHPNWVSTPLVQQWEDKIKKAQGPLLTPESVADDIVQQIVSCRGGQLIIPKRLNRASGIRAWPNWLQEMVRDSASKVQPY